MPSLAGRDAMAQLAAAHARKPARQGRARRFLDLFLHQLPAHAALRARLGREIQGQGPRRHRRACAGIRLREEHRQRDARRARTRHHLSGRDRQRLCDLAGLQQRVLAGALLHRRRKAASAIIISAKATTPNPKRSSSQLLAEAGRIARCDGHREGLRRRRRSGARHGRRAIAGDLYRLRARREFRLDRTMPCATRRMSMRSRQNSRSTNGA